MDRIMIIKAILIAAAAMFYISTILFVLKRKVLGTILAIIGSTLNLTIVGYNFFVNGYVPFVSMYQVLTFLAISFMLTYLYIHFVLKIKWLTPYFTACSALVLTGVSFMEFSIVWHFPPALQSFWFIPHVFSYMLSYSLCAVAFLIVVISLIRRNNSLETDRGVYNIVRVAFPFMTTGLLFGAIWANEIWGDFWSWDAKENWALVTWCFYTIYLHCVHHNKLKKYAIISLLLGFVSLLITFFGVNLMNVSGLHTYT